MANKNPLAGVGITDEKRVADTFFLLTTVNHISVLFDFRTEIIIQAFLILFNKINH